MASTTHPSGSYADSLAPVALYDETVSACEPEAQKSSSRPLRLAALIAVGLLAGAAVAGLANAHRSQPQVQALVVPGAPAPNTTPTGALTRWRTKQVSVALDSSLDAIPDCAKQAVRSGFGTWAAAGAKLPAVAFLEDPGPATPPARDGVNRISLGRLDIPGHEHDLALTLAYADEANGDIVEVDIVFNEEYPFACGATEQVEDPNTLDSCKSSYDPVSIAAHEAGHFWGLGEDQEEPDSTMYYATSPCSTAKRVLKKSDAEAVVSLYSDDEPATIACAMRELPGRSGSSATMAGALVGLLALQWRKRRANS